MGLLAGCTGVSGTGGKGYVTSDGSITELDPAERGEPVELTGEDLDGEALSLEELRGKPVVVNVWASWCEPCVLEQPDLNAAAEELGDRVAFVGINIRDASVENARAFARTYDVAYPSIHSDDGRALLSFSGRIGPRDLPSTVVLDEQGRIAAVVRGRIPTPRTLTSTVEKVLGE